MPRTVLIVDDNEINLRILRRILADEYVIVEAENGQVALEQLEAAKRDISAVLLDLVMPVMDGYQVLEAMSRDAALSQIPVIVATGASELDAERRALSMGANDFVFKPFDADIIKHRLRNLIRLRETAAMVNTLRRDEVTGLLLRKFFFEQAAEMIARHEPGYYVMASFDVNNFKVVNDLYGSQKGDDVLRQIAQVFLDGFSNWGGLSCRIMADNFAVLYPSSLIDSPELAEIRYKAAVLDGSIHPLTQNVGRYVVEDLTLPVSGMYDRAVLAQMSIKGRYDVPFAVYDESMRTALLNEQILTSEMGGALSDGQFEVWFQPQYNHSSGAMVGAEALVRWRHPQRGIIPPGDFIPVFERNGFIYELDKVIWAQTCNYLKKWLEPGRSPLPVSVNISRYDILQNDMVDVLLGLVRSYGIPMELLRLEVTESAFAGDSDRIISVVRQLVDSGFTVEIDDFGSGYSSLNTLKDVPAQIVKLDMRFLQDISGSNRGGNIVESVVRMVKWLGMSVIAEGVETAEQADYLASIGCYYVQGYLYSRPIPAVEYEALAGGSVKEHELISVETVENMDNNAFWDPNSMDTLIFNSYVGGACILEYYDGAVELLRVNKKFAEALGAHRFSLEDALQVKLSEHMDAENSRKLLSAIDKAASSGEEVCEEVCFTALDGSGEINYASFTARTIARTGSRYLIYNAVTNTSAQRQAERKERRSAVQLRTIMANMNGGVSAVSVVGGDVRLVFANDRYYEILGYTRDQFHNELQSAFDLVYPGDLERIRAEVDGVLRSGDRAVYEYRCRRRDGELVWLRCNAAVSEMEGVEGRVLLSVITDITEISAANAALGEIDDQLSFLSDTALDLLAQPEVDVGIEQVLKKTLKYFSGSRACIVEISASGDCSSVTYEACADGMPSEMGNTQDIPLSAYSYLWSALKKDSYIQVDSVADMAEDAAQSRFLFQTRGIFAFIAISLKKDGRIIGFIGVDNPSRYCSHTGQLTALGDYVAVMLARRDLTGRNAQLGSDRQELLPAALSTMMDSSTDLVYFKDLELRYIKCNRAAAEIVGFDSPDEFIGKTDVDIFSPWIAARYNRVDRQVISTGEPVLNLEEIVPAKGGVLRYTSTSKYPLLDAEQKVIGILGIGRDTTEERTAYAQLQLLTESVPSGLATYVFSDDGMRLVYFNDGLCRMMGYSREEYAALTSHDIITSVCQEDIPSLLLTIASILDSGEAANCFFHIRRGNDGEIRRINLRTASAEWHGVERYINAVLVDVTGQGPDPVVDG